MPDILIRGMEMPDGCHHCRFSYLDEGETNDGEPCTVIMCSAMEQGTNGAEYDGNRPSWCPLVPLPEGHGKIIDADAIWRNMTDDQGWVFQWGLASDLELFEILEAAEAIVPAEGGTDECSEN